MIPRPGHCSGWPGCARRGCRIAGFAYASNCRQDGGDCLGDFHCLRGNCNCGTGGSPLSQSRSFGESSLLSVMRHRHSLRLPLLLLVNE